MPSSTLDSQRALFDWLAVRDPWPAEPVDIVIGFGHFDLAIPRDCAEFVRTGRARHLIFTGGIGAGTADLGQPEADAFAAEVAKTDPELARAAIVENRSTNTGDNIRFTSDLLTRRQPPLTFGDGLQSALLVATPCRQRRVWLTWQKLVPQVRAWNAPPATPFAALEALYASKREDLRRQLVGEVERIRDYPARGWIADSTIPSEILDHARIVADELQREG